MDMVHGPQKSNSKIYHHTIISKNNPFQFKNYKDFVGVNF